MVDCFSILGALALALFHWRFFFFFRDPERAAPPGRNVISPADGRVVYIKKVKNNTVPISIKKRRKIPLSELTHVDDFRDTDAYVIGIFMRPTDVHVNRAPIAGQVTNIHYHKAQNLPMTMMWLRSLLGFKPYEKHAHHILQNERNTVVIAGDITVAVVQIAELYVRRIVCAVREGSPVGKGERFGMIRMGSQVDCAKVVRARPDLRGVRIHPTQLYAHVVYASMSVGFLLLLSHRTFDGMLAALYLLGHSATRYALERFRDDDRGRLWGPFTHTNLYSLLMVIGGVAALGVGAGGTVTPVHADVGLLSTLATGSILGWVVVFGLGFGLVYGVHYGKVGQWLSNEPPVIPVSLDPEPLHEPAQ